MSRSQYPYPPDEFDVRSPDDAPVGVHRAPRSTWSNVWPFLLVAAIAVAVAVAGVTFLSRDGGTPNEAGTDTTQTQPEGETPAEGETPTEGETAGEAPADGETSAEGETPAEGEGETSAEGEAPAGDLASLLAAADLGAEVRVLNASGIAGEAGRGQEALTAQGFTVVTADNFSGTAPSATSVWYAEGRSDTAAAVAAVLGIPAERVSQQTLRQGDVVVVVTAALTPAD